MSALSLITDLVTDVQYLLVQYLLVDIVKGRTCS